MMPRALWLAVCCVAVCVSQDSRAGEPVPATPQQVQQTTDRAIAYLQKESGSWMSSRKCAACHHAGMPLWALAEAERHGYAVDKKFLTETVDSIIGSREKLVSSRLFNDPAAKGPADTRPLARALKMGAVFMAVAAQSLPSLTDGQKATLKEINAESIEKQQLDGSWEFFLCRPPINETQTTEHIWAVMALQGENTPDTAASQHAAVERGIAWLDRKPNENSEKKPTAADPAVALKPNNNGPSAIEPETFQSQVMRLLLAIRIGKSHAEVQPRIDEILKLQQTDGGWAQLPESPSDAFATGETLYALALAGENIGRPEIQRAINFLVTTQKPDGSWPMTSRASNDGSPGGSSKNLAPINCAAASWATLGLVNLVPGK